MRSSAVVRIGFAMGALLLAGVANAQDPRTLTVRGEGKASAAPDTGHIQLGVEARAPTAGEALSRNSDRMREVMAKLKSAGVADRDIQTTQLDVSPEYARNDGRTRNEPPKIVGYRVSNQVQVRVRNLDALGSILDAVVEAGANRIHGLRFSVADPERLLDRAREAAAKNARSRADVYAAAAGVRVVRVLHLQEAGTIAPPPQPRMRAEAMVMDAGPPVARGEQDFRARVSVTYEIE